jgi:hypothetical protein
VSTKQDGATFFDALAASGITSNVPRQRISIPPIKPLPVAVGLDNSVAGPPSRIAFWGPAAGRDDGIHVIRQPGFHHVLNGRAVIRARRHGYGDAISYEHFAGRREGNPVAQSPGAEPERSESDSAREFRFERSSEFSGQLPLDVLPPEAIERLRAGGDLTPEEMAMLRSRALADSGPMGRLIGAAITSGLFRETGRGQTSQGPELPGEVRTYEWKWPTPTDQPPPVIEPATYYELLSGREDPHREFFVTARQLLNVVAWVVAIGLPLLLVGIGVASGESPETIFFMGVFGLIIGVMIRKSIPRSLFG